MSTVGCYFPGTRFRSLFIQLFFRGWYGVQSSSSSFSRPSLCQKSVSPFGYLVCQTCTGIDEQFSTQVLKSRTFCYWNLENTPQLVTVHDIPVTIIGFWKSEVSSCTEIINGVSHSSCAYCSCKGAILLQVHEPQLQWIYAQYTSHQGSTRFSCGKLINHFTTLFFHWWYLLTSMASSATIACAATGPCGVGLTSTEHKQRSTLLIHPSSCLWRALPIRAGWWRPESDDIHSLHKTERLPEGPHAPSLPHLRQHLRGHLCPRHLPLTRDTCSVVASQP